ncbi:hypothetical protein, partial [uncultured Lacinutrix sp.]|uniref:hypothetical protein n=1 Tax=uncultured Lacinutrix sp. TaxID=574032 RepID=UPI0026354560
MLKNTFKVLLTLVLLFQYTTVLAQQPNDCANALVVCGDSDVVLDVNGAGNNSNEFPDSCSSNENNSLWLEVTVVTSGTLAFTLSPNSTAITEDYDFFIFGPNPVCGSLGAAIRCSTTNPQASGQGNNLTGLSTAETDVTEGPGATGNSFVSAINATTGESYFIVIDRPVGNSPFSLDWTGTAQFSEAPTSETDPIGDALDITICNTGNSSSFNLEQNTPLIIGSQTDVEVFYYENESDANIGINAITSPYSNLTNGQIIYATITNTNTGCFTIQDFNLFLDPTPIINMPPNIEVCDDDLNDQIELFNLDSQTNTILGTQDPADFSVSYHETAADADSGNNALVSPFLNITNPDEIFIRVTPTAVNNSCYVFSSTPFNLIVNSQPQATAIPDYGICDADGDGFAEFNLTTQDTALINGQTNVIVSYFLNQTDAIANNNAIPNPGTYTNTDVNIQEIFVRLENTTSTCFTTTSFNIIAQAQPIATPIQDYSICDNNTDGDDTNGFTIFDLTTQNAALINGQANTTATYFENLIDAQNNTNPIAAPTTFTNTTVNGQPIFVRLEGSAADCFTVTQFNIVVDDLPEVQNATLVQCDEDGIPDGFTEYNLNEANENVMVNGNTSDFTYTHHLTFADAQAAVNSVNPSPFTNTSNPQTIYVRVENTTTGCFRTAEYVLEVTATDINNAGLNICDDDYDGFAQFTLSNADATILATLPPGLTVAYYETANDAQLEINQLPDLYTNTVPFTQTIFIRVENANDCFGIANMNITVDPLPQNNTVNNLEVCSDTPTLTNIDLTQFNAEVLGTQNATNFTINYFETQTNADNNTNALTSPYTNSNNPQSIFVRVENNTTGCTITTINFEIIVNINPEFVIPTPLEICDDTTPDGINEFDLTLKNNEISGGNPAYAVTYYFTQADADAQANPLVSPYTNVVPNMQTIYVGV